MHAIVALSILTVSLSTATGALFRPDAYTLRGVEAVNGSSENGNCPSQCVTMISNTRTCFCGFGFEDQIDGVLIDGASSTTIDFTRRDGPGNFVWASQLFTVRRNTGSTGEGNVTISFRFSNSFTLREVELYMFNCPTWRIGAQSITVHDGGGSFPSTSTSLVVELARATLTEDCTSLTKISIPIMNPQHETIYAIAATTLYEWVHLGVVRFSDQFITTSPPTTQPPTTQPPTTQPSTTQPPATSTLMTTIPVTDTTDNSQTMPNTSNLSTSMTTTEVITPNNTMVSSEDKTTGGKAMTSTEQDTAAIPTEALAIGPIVGGLVAVVLVLLILLIIGGVVVFTFFVRTRQKNFRTEVENLQNVVLENGTSKTFEPDTSVGHENCHYQKTQFEMKKRPQLALPEQPVPVAGLSYSTLEGGEKGVRLDTYEPGYSDIGNHSDTLKTANYDVIGNPGTNEPEPQYSTVDNAVEEKKKALASEDETKSHTSLESTEDKPKGYSLVVKQDPPNVPKKTPELYRALEIEKGDKNKMTTTVEGDEYYTEVGGNLTKSFQEEDEKINPAYVSTDDLTNPAYYASVTEDKNVHLTFPHTAASPTNKSTSFLGDYSEIENDNESKQDGVYSEVKDEGRPAKKKTTSGPVVLAGDFYEDMESNPNYESADALVKKPPPGAKKQEDGEAIYTNPDALDKFYDTVYSERIQPSMFTSPAAPTQATSDPVSDKQEAKGTDQEGEDEDIYSPIYDLTSSMSNKAPPILQLKPDNIKKIKTLGTGYFGKVILAKTVNFSLKELGMSEDDNDKTKSVRVAVKKLRQNPSQARKEAFEKELKFMSRLNHPNVVRILGACTEDVPFIMMEYMEKGDLNSYLQDFDKIVPGEATDQTTISEDTLIYMSMQIANAMKYLASKNYIHRDLATRNCLVGADAKIKISDFGMSRNLYESHYYVIKGNAILPIRWMAKESFYGKFSAKSDVWSFGVTMWEIFTLAKDIPYEDMEDSEVAMDASSLDSSRVLLERPESCPESVYAVMMMCWADEPKERSTFDELHKALLSLCTTHKAS